MNEIDYELIKEFYSYRKDSFCGIKLNKESENLENHLVLKIINIFTIVAASGLFAMALKSVLY